MLQPQLLARGNVVVGIEHPGDVLRGIAVNDSLDVVAVVDCAVRTG